MEVSARISKRGKENLRLNNLGYLSQGGMFVLAVLQSGPQIQADICRHLRQKPSSMMEMLQRLRCKKLVTPSEDALDGRKVNWEITRKGIRELSRAREIIRNGIGKEIDGFLENKNITAEKVEKLKLFLHEMRDYLDQNREK